MSGNISESFDYLKKCHAQNDQNQEYLKQIARALYLMGKPKSALEVANEAMKSQPYDWVDLYLKTKEKKFQELHQTKGLCYKAMKDFNLAIECFRAANQANKHEATYLSFFNSL